MNELADKVILVDEADQEIGSEEKIIAHRKGLLHRAFSIFVFNSRNELLLQKRAAGKYHSPGLWTNTCCSHPRPGEPLEVSIHRRLQFEMGFDCELKKAFHFIYRVEFNNGLIEHEFDHVFTGVYDRAPQPYPDEVQEFRWIDWQILKGEVAKNPDRYADWFRIAFEHPHWNRKDGR